MRHSLIHSRLYLAGLILMVMVSAAAWASAGEINGMVSGPNNTGLAGAQVSILNITSGRSDVLVSGARGLYRAVGLVSGAYEVKAELQGFETTTVAGINLADGDTRSVDLEMSVATIQELVTVVADAPRDSLEAAETRESPARDPGEALSMVPGVTKLRKGGIANDVVLRGFQSKDLNVLVDGQRVYGACPNHMDPPAFHVDFAEVERIEVGKGPFDAKNQGSLGGVVNIITRKPEQGFRAGGDISTGSFGFVNPSATASYGSRRFSALGGYSYRMSEPYTDGLGKRFTEYANYRPGYLSSDAYRVGTMWMRLYASPMSNHRASLSYTRQNADHVLYPYLMMDAIYDDADRASAGYEIENGSTYLNSIRFQGYYSRVNHWMTDEYRLSSNNMPRVYGMGTLALSKVAGGRAEGDTRDLTFGVESFNRSWNATTQMGGMAYMPQYSIPDVDIQAVGIYANYHKSLTDRIRVNANVRMDHARSSADPSLANTNLYYAYNSTRVTEVIDTYPSGSAHLAWSAGSGFEISAGVGHMVRIPDAAERFYGLRRSGSDWVGNPLLVPARNTGFDGSVTFRHGPLLVNSSVYFYRVQDFITVVSASKVNAIPGIMNSSARTYENTNAHLWGGETQIVHTLNRRLYLDGNLSWVVGSQDVSIQKGIVSPYLAEMPPLASRAGIRYDTGRYWVAVEGIAAAPQHRIDTGLRELPTPGYGIANIKSGINIRRVALRVGLNNVLNHGYCEHLSFQRDPFRTGIRVNEPGRNLYVNLSYRY